MFVDFNQNAPHKNVFGAWGVRARAGRQVSTPIEWDELMTVEPDELTMLTVPERLAERGDPWHDMDDEPQDIEPLVEPLRRGPGGRHPRRAVAARLPEDAQRGAAGPAQPRPQGRAEPATVNQIG